MEDHPSVVTVRLRGLDPGRVLGLLDDDLQSPLPDIPGWRVAGIAGRGGGGIVWRAVRETDGAVAAIKIAPPSEPDTVERIEREAGFLRDLRHPNIVGLLETGPLLQGTDEGGLYMAMEFIDGPSLQHEIPEHGLPPQQAYQWFREIATAVTYAHDCGILHRDLKPANVLLAPDGRIKVADFGLARPVHRRVHMLSLTRAGLVAGTAEYLPPEAYHRDYRPGPAADIFALGVMLHEMLTGTPPRGAWQPASFRKGVDVRIDGLIRRAMDPDPALRWPDAGAMLAELGRILGSSPRYSGTPLVTRSIQLADCLWTLLGLSILLAGTSSLLHLRKARFSLPLDLVGGHAMLTGGFHALFYLLAAGIPLALWQVVRLRRFRHVPMREALPSPFGLKLGHGPGAAWLVAICQFFCFFLPLLQMLTICTDSSRKWLKPDDPPWAHGLAVTGTSDFRIVNPWKFQPLDQGFWLRESHGPPDHPLARVVDQTTFIPGYVPAIMATGAVLLVVALLATLLTAGRGWWSRGRRLHVIASFALLVAAGRGIGDAHHREFRDSISPDAPAHSSSWWARDRMTEHLLHLARATLDSRITKPENAATAWREEWYAPMVDYRDKGLIDRTRIAGYRAAEAPPPGKTTCLNLDEERSWNPDCGTFHVMIDRVEYWDAPEVAGAARLVFRLSGTVTPDGHTAIRAERMETAPMYECPPQHAGRRDAAGWAHRFDQAVRNVAAAEPEAAGTLAEVFATPLMVKQGRTHACLNALETSQDTEIFRNLLGGDWIVSPDGTRVVGPQPGGRTRIVVPLRDPHTGGRPELTVDLILLDGVWRAAGLAF